MHHQPEGVFGLLDAGAVAIGQCCRGVDADGLGIQQIGQKGSLGRSLPATTGEGLF